MNPNALERDLEQWLQTEAPASAPAGFHAAVMDRARTLRQRPGWATTLPVRRFGRGRGMTLLAAAALLLVGGAWAAGSGILRLPTVVPPVPEPSVVAIATASPDATSPSPSELAAPSASPIPVAGPGGVWIPTGSMTTPRSGHDAVRLRDGRVLVVGGQSAAGDDLTSAELYDPATATWSATGAKIPLEHEIPPTLLRDGTVLVGDAVYNPANGTWNATGKMVGAVGAGGNTVTVLRDGRVLVVDGYGDAHEDGATSAELYDPASGTWTATGKMNDQGYQTTAVLLSDGKVLVAGGSGFGPPSNPDYYVLDSAQIYDPVTGSWTAIASMHAKASLTAALLQPDGKVLVVGSLSPTGFPARIHAEVYDPATGTWTALAQPTGSNGFHKIGALLSDGTVLMTDPKETNLGPGPAAQCTAAALYDPYTGSTTTASSMLRCGAGSSLTLLLDGPVLKAGGSDCNDDVCVANGAAELYVPAGVSPPRLPAFPSPAPPVFPSPTPTPTTPPLLPPADGPVPPNARSWTITVENMSSEPATMFVAEGEEGAFRLVGSATPNVVPAGATVQVTFLFPAKGVPDDGWISVNPRLGEGADVGSVGADNIGRPGKIRIREEGDSGWVGPA